VVGAFVGTIGYVRFRIAQWTRQDAVMIVGAAILAAHQTRSSQMRMTTESESDRERIASYQMRCLAAPPRPLRLCGSIVRIGANHS